MKITEVAAWQADLPLARPYTIAFATVSETSLFFVRLVSDTGHEGLGSAAPVSNITGESGEACLAALQRAEALLRGHDARQLGTLTRLLRQHLRDTPAARAALDMALYDLFTRSLGLPLVDFLGRWHKAMPTSITIGIKPTDEALDEADEYLQRGFRCLKVKLGHAFEEEVERLRRIRERVGPEVLIRVDANQGYTLEETRRFEAVLHQLDLEMLEQPVPKYETRTLRQLTPAWRAYLAADERMQDETDAFALLQPEPACGIYNIKLMKCGGITPARRIGMLAEAADIAIMWGCMDESCISIAAALHAAYASPNTRYLDLDGSFDLARDLATGGFVIEPGGILRLTEQPGLGVSLVEG